MIKKVIMLSAVLIAVSGCAPEVGSKKWCESLEEKPKGDWTANELADYSKHCLFRDDEE